MAGTDPTDVTSWFHIKSIAPAGGGFTVKWDSATGRNYTVLKSGLLSGGWTPASGSIAGTGGEISFTDATAPVASRFYKIQVTLP